MKEALHEGIRFTKEWYGGYVTRTALPVWISGAKGLIEMVGGDAVKGRRLSVSFSSDPEVTGSIGLSIPTEVSVTIGSVFLSEALHKTAGVKDSERPLAIIGCSNGTVVHEAGHARYATEAVLTRAAVGKLAHELPMMHECINRTEDLFLEAKLRSEFPELSKFVSMKNAFVFTDELLGESFNREDWNDAGWILQLCTVAKELKESWFEVVAGTFKEAVNVEKLSMIVRRAMNAKAALDERVAVARDLYEFVVRTTGMGPDEVSKVGHPIKSENEGKEFIGLASGKSEAITELITEAKAALEKNDRLIKIVEMLTKAEEAEFSEGHSVTMIDTAKDADTPLALDPAFEGLEKKLTRMVVPRSTYGQAKPKGRLVATRLSRIATDGKVFADPVVTTTFDMGIELVELVDGSGSMRMGSNRPGLNLFEAALSAAATIKIGLDSIRVPCSVWAHSGDVENEFNVTLTQVAPHQRVPKATVQRRARWTSTSPWMREQNRDGEAIEWAGKNAFKTSKRRVLVVLSDGEPWAHGYQGERAISHTQREVEKLRRNGTVVVAVSLTSGVLQKNDRIYGSKFNLDATSGNIAERIAEVIMENTTRKASAI